MKKGRGVQAMWKDICSHPIQLQFCFPQCINQHNVYKCRAKKDEE